MAEKYYLTTTAPYVNAKPHIGFALEIIQADVLARYHAQQGDEVFFNTGTDEHGKKIYEKAQEEEKEPQDYVDEYAAKFDDLKKALNLSYNSFQRSTNPDHLAAAQELWRRVAKAGYIEKGIYKAKYCVGCELEKQDSDLVDGKCPLHPNKELELIEEENYFFKFSRLADRLLAHYNKYPDFVVPENRQKEIRNFVEAGLADFSISRLKEKMPWGVEVPGDDKHVMYVWFDALTYYISALGWPQDETKFAEFWGTKENPKAIQVAGKDNLRQQTAMWQAMLLAAGLPPSRQVLIHGFITSGGQKMSKSLGNVVDPMEYVKQYGTDALRYYLLAKIHPFEDSDFTREKFEEVYQGELANGLGNLVARVAAMAASTEGYIYKDARDGKGKDNQICVEIDPMIQNYRFDQALQYIWGAIRGTDEYLSKKRPWQLKMADENQKLSKFVILNTAINNILNISEALNPFMPETAEKMREQFAGEKIVKAEALFPRLG